MNFPSDVISKAVVISDELRQKQLPERPNKSNAILTNSSVNRRTPYRSTLLETSTSEHSHLLRLFYNLYADMVSINRMEITMKEKQELLTRKMRELAEDLPLHILELAKNGNLFEIFKRSQNMWTPPKQNIIEEEQLPADVSQSLTVHDATNFSLLSQNSIARRIELDLQDLPTNEPTPLPQKSNIRSKAPVQHQAKVQFLSDIVDEMHIPELADDYFTENRLTSGSCSSKINDNNRNFDFMDASVDFIDHELTQYFNDISPEHKDKTFEDDPFTTDFLVPNIFDKSNRSTNIDKPRSYQNTSTEAHPATSSKEYTKSKSTNMNTSQKSSSSSGLFRLQLKSPLKVKDNRILKTPPKNVRTQNESLKEFTFNNSKGPTERRSTPRLSFSLFNDFNDNDFTAVEIPEIPSSSNHNSDEFTPAESLTNEYCSSSQNSNNSASTPFQLNLTQFCARETAEDQFFCTSQYFPSDEAQQFPEFPELSDDVLPIPSKTKYRDATTTDARDEDESFAFSDVSRASSTPATRTKTSQFDNIYPDRYAASQVNDETCISISQDQSQNFFNLGNTSQNVIGPDKYKVHQPITESFIKKVTVAPEITRPTALQFIQFAYQNESDKDSSTDDEEIQGKTIPPSTRQEGTTAKSVTYSYGNQNKNQQKSAMGTDTATVTEQQKLLTESFNNSTANIEGIILPVPPQFL